MGGARKSLPKPSLLGLNIAELQKELHSLGLPKFRSAQIYRWIHQQNVDSFAEMTNLSKELRAELAEKFCIKTMKSAAREVSSDGTEKFLWELYDGRRVESVLIPDGKRTTICISSQVGCSLGCEFCATAQMGYVRSLTAGEIVEQVLQIQKRTERRITNVVFMGMGEPFLNYRRVIRASEILGDSDGVAISNRRITISTAGITPRIRDFTEERQPFSLAISLHAPTQELRESFMPVARKFPLNELMSSAALYLNLQKRRRITFEYILLDGVNDSPAEAKALLRLLSPLRCKLNLIPCNKTYLDFRAPAEERVRRFVSILRTGPFAVMLRKNRGQDIAAACGQLFVKTNSNGKARSLKAASPA